MPTHTFPLNGRPTRHPKFTPEEAMRQKVFEPFERSSHGLLPVATKEEWGPYPSSANAWHGVMPLASL